MAAIHFFHRLVFSARLFMKKAWWCSCVLDFDSSGEPAAQPGINGSGALEGTGTEFGVGRLTSYEEGADATMNAPMDLWSSMGYFYFCIRQDLSRFASLLVSGPAKVPIANFGEEDFSIQAEKEAEKVKKCQNNWPFTAFSATCISPNWIFQSRSQSKFFGAGFRGWYVTIEMMILLAVLHGSSSITLFFVLDYSPVDPAITPINSTGHQLVNICP